jgi:hypothetical protein
VTQISLKQSSAAMSSNDRTWPIAAFDQIQPMQENVDPRQHETSGAAACQLVGQAITPCWNSTGEQPSTWGHSVRSLLKWRA